MVWSIPQEIWYATTYDGEDGTNDKNLPTAQDMLQVSIPEKYRIISHQDEDDVEDCQRNQELVEGVLSHVLGSQDTDGSQVGNQSNLCTKTFNKYQ